jgi:hypothetical protein
MAEMTGAMTGGNEAATGTMAATMKGNETVTGSMASTTTGREAATAKNETAPR